jgi:DNA repair protein RecO (recombination protein O)
MLTTTKAIVFSAIKYQDDSLIVSCFTKELGIKPYLLKGVFKSRKSSVKPALFQILSLLEITANHKKEAGINFIKEVRVYSNYKTLQTQIHKNAIAQFLSEILSIVVKEEEANVPLYDFIEYSLLWLDEHNDCANFHLSFLMQLTTYLGCYPDTTNAHLEFFNLETGRFSANPLTNFSISGAKLRLFKSVLGTNFDAVKNVKLTASQRQDFLTIILDYFNLHLFDFKKPKSLEILSKLFS